MADYTHYSKIVASLIKLAQELINDKEDVQAAYPTLAKVLDKHPNGDPCSWEGFDKASDKKKHLETCAVYSLMSAYGPKGISFEQASDLQDRLKGVDVLKTFEAGSLHSALAKAGFYKLDLDSLGKLSKGPFKA